MALQQELMREDAIIKKTAIICEDAIFEKIKLT